MDTTYGMIDPFAQSCPVPLYVRSGAQVGLLEATGPREMDRQDSTVMGERGMLN